MLAAAHGGFAEVVPHTLSSHSTRRTSSVEHALSSLIGLSVLTTLFKREFYSNLLSQLRLRLEKITGGREGILDHHLNKQKSIFIIRALSCLSTSIK
jgi:hypothetical protein